MTSKPTKEQLARGMCPGHSYDGHLWPCSKNPVKDGYCGTHHPKAEAKREKKKRKFMAEKMKQCDARIKAEIEFQRRGLAYPRLMAEIKRLKAALTPTNHKSEGV